MSIQIMIQIGIPGIIGIPGKCVDTYMIQFNGHLWISKLTFLGRKDFACGQYDRKSANWSEKEKKKWKKYEKCN